VIRTSRGRVPFGQRVRRPRQEPPARDKRERRTIREKTSNREKVLVKGNQTLNKNAGNRKHWLLFTKGDPQQRERRKTCHFGDGKKKGNWGRSPAIDSIFDRSALKLKTKKTNNMDEKEASHGCPASLR